MNSEQYVVFSMAMQQYAFPLTQVIEILRVPKITYVPGVASTIEGVINVRGAILPVINLHVRFHMEVPAKHKTNRIIIIQHEQEQIGLIVERMDKVTHMEHVPMEDTAFPHIEEDIFIGFGKAAGQIVGILDVQKVL